MICCLRRCRLGCCVEMIETAENIHLAAYNDEIDILKKIYENNPSDVFKLSLSGNNCLHIAAASNSLRVLRFLIEINDHSLLNSLNKWKETALHLGTAAGNVDVVIILLEAGANVLLSDQWNRTPKMVSCLSYIE